jgi:hypothetical protein
MFCRMEQKRSRDEIEDGPVKRVKHHPEDYRHNLVRIEPNTTVMNETRRAFQACYPSIYAESTCLARSQTEGWTDEQQDALFDALLPGSIHAQDMSRLSLRTGKSKMACAAYLAQLDRGSKQHPLLGFNVPVSTCEELDQMQQDNVLEHAPMADESTLYNIAAEEEASLLQAKEDDKQLLRLGFESTQSPPPITLTPQQVDMLGLFHMDNAFRLMKAVWMHDTTEPVAIHTAAFLELYDALYKFLFGLIQDALVVHEQHVISSKMWEHKRDNQWVGKGCVAHVLQQRNLALSHQGWLAQLVAQQEESSFDSETE